MLILTGQKQVCKLFGVKTIQINRQVSKTEKKNHLLVRSEYNAFEVRPGVYSDLQCAWLISVHTKEKSIHLENGISSQNAVFP